ncbi:putative oxidoreductase C162,03 [Talaromyces islandicus]|uniref:Putative oxidoreductase C162,03 n=1 Tax=Talaromyces islandicus TaxID=28573 RepID=A0A0U1M0K5_TALIS|nr:putative oxidoreductase C162,03 [Talaromyces islandicus]
MPRVFFITGASSGLGRAYAQEVINRGDFVVATSRKVESLQFTGTSTKNYLPVSLEITDRASIDAALRAAVDAFGRIDVLVNNAGYGLMGIFEELTDDEINREMAVNFFATLHITRAAIQLMRDQTPCGGVIQQITSITGQCGVSMMSLYCASKWAVEGFTESIAQEMNPAWNIKFTCIEPGGFRTNFFNSISIQESKTPAYAHIDPRETAKALEKAQRGDPSKGANAMYELAVMEEPPLRIVLGSDALGHMLAKIEKYGADLKKYGHISTSTDADENEKWK